MGLSAWLELINGVLKFPSAMLSLVRVLQGTPEEHHDALVAKIQAESQAFKESGRPSWG